MAPDPININATRRSLSDGYYLGGSPTSEILSPPLEAFLPSESESHLVNSDSEDFKGQNSHDIGGLPSFYHPPGTHHKNKDEEQPPKSRKLKELTRNWHRHFEGWKVVVLDSWLNVLLIMIPVAWATRILMVNGYAFVFSFCILALIPLVRLHDITIGQLALRIGGSKAGLLNASMSNLMPNLKRGGCGRYISPSKMRASSRAIISYVFPVLGSILSKLLLILGLCFFAGGVRFSEQGFDQTATQVHSSLLSISVGVLLLPAAYHFAMSAGAEEAAEKQRTDILKMSHGVSAVLVLIYLAYLAFQLWSHTHLYQDNHNKKSARLPATQNISAEKAAAFLSARSRSTFQNRKNFTDLDQNRSPPLGFHGSSSKTPLTPPRKLYAFPNSTLRQSSSPMPFTSPLIESHPNRASMYEPATGPKVERRSIRLVNLGQHSKDVDSMPRVEKQDLMSCASPASSTITFTEFDEVGGEHNGGVPMSRAVTGDSESRESLKILELKVKQPELPQLSWFLTTLLMVTVTAAVAVTADWLVESMDGISTTISKEWVALILLPAISSIAECITAVRVSVRDELSLSVSVAVGSTIVNFIALLGQYNRLTGSSMQQTALFVIPLMVLLGWITRKPLTLLMDPFESLVLYLSVQTASYVLADGKSNWLEGFILVSLYSIIAVSFWFYPGSTPLDFLSVCPMAK